MTDQKKQLRPELSKAQQRKQDEKNLERTKEAIELFHEREQTYEEIHDLMREHWKPTEAKLKEAEYEFERKQEFHDLQLKLQELEWERSSLKRKKDELEPLEHQKKALVKRLKQRG